MKKNLSLTKRLALSVLCLGAAATVNAQCLNLTCPGTMSVAAPTSSCGAVVNYTLPVISNSCGGTQTYTYNYTGAVQTYTIPSGVTSITVTANGAAGASQSPGGNGGKGAMLQGVLAVSPGQVLNIYVGGQNGYNGGGIGGVNGNSAFSGPTLGIAGNGGGASDIRIGGITLTDRVFVAGGGGGAGHDGTWPGCQPANPTGNGGDAGITGTGGTFGSSSACACGGGGGSGGGGGTAVMGGAAGTYTGSTSCLRSNWTAGNPGVLGIGGDGSTAYYNGTGGGGGGGGGYYGGGSGANGSDTTPGGGGGGGSSFAGTATSTVITSGAVTGDGSVMITVPTSATTTTLTMTAGLASGSAFPIGTSVQTFSVTDGTNSATCSFSVMVIDNITPTLTCPGNMNQCTSSATANITSIAPVTVNDNCSASVTYSLTGATTATGTTNASGVFNTGVTNVTYMAKDPSGNSTTCSFSVTVKVNPTVTAVSNASLICSGQSATLTASGATSYTWNTSATTTVIVVSPTVTASYTVTGTAANGCTNLATVTQSVSSCTGIEALGANNMPVSVYPNPNNGTFFVQVNSENSADISICNNLGQVVKKITSVKGSNEINLSGFPTGIYSVVIKQGEQSKTVKLVIE